MKLEKAIEILIDFLQDPVLIVRPDTTKSIKLGIGALQQIAQMRLLGISPIAELLPGETKE